MTGTWHVAAAVALVAMVAPAVAQSNAGEAGPILQEVRLLRQAIENLTRSNASAQIAFGRLQLQEQRTIAATRKLEAARAELLNFERMLDEQADRVRELEGMETSHLSREDREGFTNELRFAKIQSARLEGRRQQLVADEADAAHQLALAQGEWVEINQRLTDLERVMAPGPTARER